MGIVLIVHWNEFYNIEAGNYTTLKNKHLDDQVAGYKRYSTRWFTWSNEDGYTPGIGFGYGVSGDDAYLASNSTYYMNNPTIYFPGLKGANLNASGTDNLGLSVNGDNPFNPKNGGNNLGGYSILSRLKRG